MVKTFLPGMVTRKAGRIVAIASMSAKISAPLGTVYTATKFGIDGFMESLFDDLCLDDHDKFIKLSTAFPYFIRTRKEFADKLKEINDLMPSSSPKFVADRIVDGVRLEKRKIYISPSISLFFVQ